MSFPLESYIAKSRAEGRSEEFIKLTTEYATYLDNANLPVIFSLEHLAIELGMQSSFIKSIIADDSSHYIYFLLKKKKKNSFREIVAPKEELKFIQRWINFNILQNREYNEYTTGFIPGASIVKNAQVHLGAKYLMKIDLLKFFDSISHKRVWKIFEDMGYVSNLAHDLASLCTASHRKSYWSKLSTDELDKFTRIGSTVGKILPQGAPTSPLLSNLAAHKLDMQIIRLSDVMGFNYSRYADDLCFSASTFSQLPSVNVIREYVQQNGFFINEEKVKVSKSGMKQYVTGLSISGTKVSVQKEKRREIFKHLYFARKHGLKNHIDHLKSIGKYHQNFQNWLFGNISFHLSIDQEIGHKMLEEYNKINWDLSIDDNEKVTFKTLHQAIMHVLKDGRAKSFEEISQAIADQNLWRRKKDGTFPEAFQIRLRTVANKHYRTLFKVAKDGKIKLKKA